MYLGRRPKSVRLLWRSPQGKTHCPVLSIPAEKSQTAFKPVEDERTRTMFLRDGLRQA